MTKDDEELADLLAGMGIDAGGWAHELTRQSDTEAPLDPLILGAEGMRQELQRRAARASGKRLYDVTLRFENVLAEDKTEAIEEGEAGYGHLRERSAELVYDPTLEEAVEGEALSEERSPLEIRPDQIEEFQRVTGDAFLRLIDELCIDPVTGETVLPDLVMMSQELYEAIVNDPRSKLLRPRDELTFFEFPLRVVPHHELEAISGSQAHLLAFDRRRTLRESVASWETDEEEWEQAVQATVET